MHLKAHYSRAWGYGVHLKAYYWRVWSTEYILRPTIRGLGLLFKDLEHGMNLKAYSSRVCARNASQASLCDAMHRRQHRIPSLREVRLKGSGL